MVDSRQVFFALALSDDASTRMLTAADIDKTQADATHKRSTAYKAQVDAELAPKWAVHDAAMEKAQFVQDAHDAHEDRKMNAEAKRMLAHKRSGGDA